MKLGGFGEGNLKSLKTFKGGGIINTKNKKKKSSSLSSSLFSGGIGVKFGGKNKHNS